MRSFSLLTQAFTATYFPLSTSFTASLKFCYVVCLFSFILCFLWPTGYLRVWCVIHVFVNFQNFLFTDFNLYSTVVGTRFVLFNPFQSIEACFMAQHVAILENVYYALGKNVYSVVGSSLGSWFKILFNSSISLLIFFLVLYTETLQLFFLNFLFFTSILLLHLLYLIHLVWGFVVHNYMFTNFIIS